MGLLLGRYLSENSGPPKDRAEFVAWLAANPSEWSGLGIDTPEQFLTSPHDQKSLIVITGSKPGPQSPGGLPYVAYEQGGTNGTFLAINARGGVTELTEEEVRKLFPSNH